MSSRIYWITVSAALTMLCLWVHCGLVIFVGILTALAFSIYWLVGSRSLFRVGLATLLTVVAYFSSVAPVIELVIAPRFDRAFAGEEFEPHWIDDSWEFYATPYAKACDTEIGKKILMPYHRAWTR